MHYVNCINCDAYYSADGNPYYITDAGDVLCENCSMESTEIDREQSGEKVTYTLSNEYSLELLTEVSCDVENSLKRNNVPFVKIMQNDGIDVYEIQEADIITAKLRGVDVNQLIYMYF